MKNLHISLTEFRNESRVIKEAESIVRSGLVDAVFVAGLHADGLLKNEIYSEKLEIHRFSLRSREWGGGVIVQILKYIEFSLCVILFYKRKSIKIVNIHSLALLPLGIILKTLFRAKLVYDAHELETEKNGVYGFKKKISKYLERWLIKYVDLTVVVSPSISDWYASEYKIPNPIVVLNAPKRTSLQVQNHFRKDLGIRADQKILIYQGLLASGRGITSILDAFKARANDEVVVVFMGYGPLTADINQASDKYNNIFHYPAVSPDVVLEYTSSADIGISLIENSCLSYFYCMPNKLFEYAMAGLPVLVSNMKDMSELVQKNCMGAVIEEFSPQAINLAIDTLLTSDLATKGNNSYRTACDHAWEVQEAIMLDAYARLNLS